MNPTAPQPVQNATPSSPNVAGFIQAARSAGIPDQQIYATLQQKNLIPQQQPAQTPAPSPTPTYGQQVGQNLGQTFQQGGQNVMQDIANIPKNAASASANPQHPGALETGLATVGAAGHVAGDIAGTAGGILSSVISPLLPDSVKNTIGDVAKHVSDKVNAIPGMTPEIAKGLGDIFNTATLLGGAKAAPAVSKVAGNVVKDVAETGSKVVQGAKEAVLGTPEEQAAAQTAKETAAQDAIKAQAIKDATPNYNKGMISEPTVNGVPRVQEGGGIIKGRVVTTTPLEKEAGEALAKVPNYPVKGTALEKYNAVQPELVKQAKALETSLQNENVLRPPKEIANIVNNAVNNVSKESLLLQKADPAIKQYMRVAKNAISENDGTLAGELKVRQALDAAYKNARGKAAFGSDRISALDEIHSAARDALNKDMIEKATNTDVKASLKSQWDLNRAADELRTKAETEGNSTIEQIMKAHPVASKVGKAAVKATGLGAALHLVP